MESLFESEHLKMGGFDVEKEACLEAAWSYDLCYARWYRGFPLRPVTAFEVKKRHEALLKSMREGNKVYHFSLRKREDDSLVGFVRINDVFWLHRLGSLEAAIGAPESYGLLQEAYWLGLRYAFEELNLHRVGMETPGYDTRSVQACEAAGMSLEVRQRRMAFFANRYWDVLQYGMLLSEWNQSEGKHV